MDNKTLGAETVFSCSSFDLSSTPGNPACVLLHQIHDICFEQEGDATGLHFFHEFSSKDLLQRSATTIRSPVCSRNLVGLMPLEDHRHLRQQLQTVVKQPVQCIGGIVHRHTSQSRVGRVMRYAHNVFIVKIRCIVYAALGLKARAGGTHLSC